MFGILTTFYNTVKGDDTDRSWKTIIKDRDKEVKQLTDDEYETEHSEDEDTFVASLGACPICPLYHTRSFIAVINLKGASQVI